MPTPGEKRREKDRAFLAMVDRVLSGDDVELVLAEAGFAPKEEEK